jgi:hypothetical protein
VNLKFAMVQYQSRPILYAGMTPQVTDHGTMEQLEADSLARLPNAMLKSMLKFVIEHAASSETAARLGQLTARGRPTINTPLYIAPTSRGVIPHLSHDNLQKHTRISAVYVPLEDCTCALSAKSCTLTFWLTVGG